MNMLIDIDKKKTIDMRLRLNSLQIFPQFKTMGVRRLFSRGGKNLLFAKKQQKRYYFPKKV